MSRTVRNPDQTRQRLLEAAFDEIYQRGYQGMRVDDVLKRTGLQKGAFYHHFNSKHALGCAVLDEVINSEMSERWVQGLEHCDDPIPAIEHIIDDLIAAETSEDEVILGCPLNNLAQEMSAQDDEFCQRVRGIFEQWIELLTQAFVRGQTAGTIRKDIDPQAVSLYLVASFEGCIGLAKATQKMDTFLTCRQQISHYLKSLQP